MNSRKFFGALLVALGVGYICQLLNIFDFSTIISTWWPLIIIIIGFMQLFKKSTSKTGAIILIAIGTIIQLNKLETNIHIGEFFWPVILILIGLKVLIPHSTFKNANEVTDDIIDYFVAFSGINVKVFSSNFRGGSITALFGGGDIDLRNAVLSNEGAVIDAFAAFGGVDIKVPTDWKVVTTGFPIFGGFENKTNTSATSAVLNTSQVLKVRCTAIFGGIDIKN